VSDCGFLFNDTATTDIYTLSLHDALPISMIGAKEDRSEAEVAIVERSDYKHRGMGWTFLEYVIEEARRDGIKKLISLESRANHEAIKLEKEMGRIARTCSDDATLIQLELDLTANIVEA